MEKDEILDMGESRPEGFNYFFDVFDCYHGIMSSVL